MTTPTGLLEILRAHAASLSPLARFAIGLAVILVVPPVLRRLKLPPVLAGLVQLPGIVGAFLVGLALNEASQNKPAKEKLGFFANTLFIPAFFLATGFLINPSVFVRSLIDHFALATSIVLALLVGKFRR